MPIRAVLFDWGGTLVRDDRLDFGICLGAVAAAAVPHGIEVAAEALARAFDAVLPLYEPGVTVAASRADVVLAAAFAHLGEKPSSVLVADATTAFAEADMARQELFEDARALLESLKYRGYRIGVVTNTLFPASIWEPHFRRLGIAGYIDVLSCSADVGRLKPDPAVYEYALRRLGTASDETVFVGDRPDTDMAGARAANIAAILIDRSGSAPAKDGYTVVSHLSALSGIVGDGPAR